MAEPRVLRGRHAHARVRRREGGATEGSGEGAGCRRESQTPPPSAARVPRARARGHQDVRLAAHRASNPSHGLVQIARDGGSRHLRGSARRRKTSSGKTSAGSGAQSSRLRSNDSRHGWECFSEFLGARSSGVRLRFGARHRLGLLVEFPQHLPPRRSCGRARSVTRSPDSSISP